MNVLLSGIVVAMLLLTVARPASARLSMPEPSPSATVTQKIGFADLAVKYSRSAVKGRTVFGKLVPYGDLWRTGASDATILTISDPMTIAGKPLPAGKYSLFTIPTRTEWTVM